MTARRFNVMMISVCTEACVYPSITNPSATVPLVLLVNIVRLMLMNVPLDLATMELPVLICLKATGVTVTKDTPDSSVRKRIQTVLKTPAQTEPCARIFQDLVTLNVCAARATRATIVMLPRTPAPRMATLAPTMLCAGPCLRAGSPASASLAGREPCARIILMIVWNSLVYLVETAQI
jgi:hypothetical protein